MAEADNPTITDWTPLPKAWELLGERWRSSTMAGDLIREALFKGMPWRSPLVQDGTTDPDLFRFARVQIHFREGWAQAIVPNSILPGPRHWIEVSLSLVLALPDKPSPDDEPPARNLKDWVAREAPRHPHRENPREEMLAYATRLKEDVLLKDMKTTKKMRDAEPKSIATRLYELKLGPRR